MLRSALIALAGFLLLARLDAQSVSPVGTGGNLEFRTGLEQEAFLLVNQYRKANKLPPLAWNGAIAQVAREHSRNMAAGKVDFGHDGFSGRVSQLKTLLAGLKGCGENVLRTDDPDGTAKKAVTLWLRSSAHLQHSRRL